MLSILQRIEPEMKELKITRKDATGLYPELLKVIKNHTRSSDYMIQFMKMPLLTTGSDACGCKACELGLFKPLRMPVETYQEVHSKLFPLPIPKSAPITPGGALVYMSMEESMRLPFTDVHQPSKKAQVVPTISQGVTSTSSRLVTPGIGRGRGSRGRGTGGRGPRGRGEANVVLRVTDVPSQASTTQKIPYRRNFPLGHKLRLRGVVQCLECTKPRCIYSAIAIANMQPPGVFTPQEQVECR